MGASMVVDRCDLVVEDVRTGLVEINPLLDDGLIVLVGPSDSHEMARVLLRILAAFLAGLNRMPWRAFLMANATGGVIWASVFGVGGYVFGKVLLQVHHALAPVVFALALVGFFGCGYLIRCPGS
jgi:hypothetical protein